MGAMFDLLSTWRSASDAHALPALLARSIPDALDGFIAAKVPTGMLAAVIDSLVNETQASTQEVITHEQRQALKRIAGKKLKQFEEKKAEIPRLRVEEAWAMYLKESAFRSAIVGLEFYAFTALYFAYECYLARVVEVVKPTSMPENTRAIRDGLVHLFGEQFAFECFNVDSVAAARSIRNAHVHCGDRLEPDDVAIVTRFVDCEGGFPLVSAFDTRRLTDDLFDRVLRITDAARKKPGLDSAAVV